MEVTILLFCYANVTRYFFLVSKDNLTPLFFTREYIQLVVMNREHLFPQDVYYFSLQLVV